MRRLRNHGILLFASLIIVAGLLFPWGETSTVSAAESLSFGDVSASYWGKPYIEFAATQQIVNGYLQKDGTYRFKPEATVTKEEAMQMLWKTAKAAGYASSTEGPNTTAREALLTQHQIATWAWPCVTYGLEKGILAETDLVGFRSDNGTPMAATRQEVALWAAKALDASMLSAVALTFTDSNDIDPTKLFYVDFLVRKGIMIGDNNGKFNPKANIKRVEYAVICKRLYALPTAAFDPATEMHAWQGTVTSVNRSAGKLYLQKTDGTSAVITVQTNTAVLLNGSRSDLGALSAGTACIISSGPFSQLHIDTAVAAGTGEVEEIEEKSDRCRIVTIQNESGVSVVYFQTTTESTDYPVINQGDQISYIADGMSLIEIQMQ